MSVDVAAHAGRGAAGLPRRSSWAWRSCCSCWCSARCSCRWSACWASCSPSAPRSAPPWRSSSGAGWPRSSTCDGTGPLLSLTPILVIGILFGLAMDYQVFLVSRMHEAHSHGAAPLAAVRTGFRQAAPVVVAAARDHVQRLRRLRARRRRDHQVDRLRAGDRHRSFDAFVVRMVLVPAALALLGERAWWLPRWLRWLPVLDVEGAGARAGAGPRDDGRPSSAAPERVASGDGAQRRRGDRCSTRCCCHTDQVCSSVMPSSARARRRGAVIGASRGPYRDRRLGRARGLPQVIGTARRGLRPGLTRRGARRRSGPRRRRGAAG